MSANDADNRQDTLGFADSVRSEIDPVLRPHGFTCVERAPDAVLFESRDVVITIMHDRLSYELEVRVWRKDEPENQFALVDVLEGAVGLAHDERPFFQASSSERVKECVSTIAGILKRYGDAMLRGDEEVFRRMAGAVALRSKELTDRVVDEPIREAVEAAWRGKDYAEVKRLYESMRGELTIVEERRLDYAQRRAQN